MRTFGKVEYVVAVLREIEDGANPASFYRVYGRAGGICEVIECVGVVEEDGLDYSMSCALDEAMSTMLHEAAKDYDEFSGDEGYPVPPPADMRIQSNHSGWGSPERYAYYCNGRWDGEYGESRRDYAGHVANYIEEHYT